MKYQSRVYAYKLSVLLGVFFVSHFFWFDLQLISFRLNEF